MNTGFARPFAALRALFRADLAAILNPELAGLRQIIIQELRHMSDTLSTELVALKADVAAQNTVIASATTAFQGLAAQLAAAEASAKAAGATDAMIADFKSTRTELEANTAALAAAIPANTPAATTTADTTTGQPSTTTEQPATPTTEAPTQAAA